MKYMLDTNICVHWLRGNSDIAGRIEECGLENCCISEITKAELLFGESLAECRGRKITKEPLRRLLSLLETVPVSGSLELYAKEKARLVSCGTPLEDFDILIGCSAIAHGCTLVTGNLRHLQRLDGIRLENWGK